MTPMTGLRFLPPNWHWTREQRWILLRAFGPIGQEARPPDDPERAVREAQTLGLAERIAARNSDDRLVAELGPAPAAALVNARERARTRATGLLDVVREVAGSAAAARIPVVPLKGAALHLAGYVRPGARPAGDVDILVPAGRAAKLSDRLRARGWSQPSVVSGDHELSPLVDAQGRVVDLHRYIPGVRVPAGKRRFARVGALQGAGLLEPPATGAAGLLLPSRHLLVAHVTVHAIAQHGFVPHSYPITRALADLCDLGVATSHNEGAWVLITRDVRPEELSAVESLCRLLGEGNCAFLDDPASAPRALLAHVVAGAFDDRYRESLMVPALVHRLAEDSRLLAILRGSWRAVRFPRHGATIARRVARVLARRRSSILD
jgi:hypothetical protein